MNPSSEKLLPGASIGVFGGGQLGRMLAQAAQRLGYRVVVFTPEMDSPAGQVAHETIIADYADFEALDRFAQHVDVVTLEFENIDLQAVHQVEKSCPVRPSSHILAVAQHRFHEKSFLRDHGFPVTPFCEILEETRPDDLGTSLGWPVILKTSTLGYDGKGQFRASDAREAELGLTKLGSGPKIAETCIDFDCEVSILVARNLGGEIATYPLFLNDHVNHILDVTTCPEGDDWKSIQEQAEEIACGVAEKLSLVGVLCIEFFVDHRRQLMINEMAPRPHNSGHLTIEACQTSQFEQQLRAICNLPLGGTRLLRPAAMCNLLGDLWRLGVPKWERVLAESDAHLHLYGKEIPKPGRKMGHITCTAETSDEAVQKARRLRQFLID